jgi:cholesterol transport system auxiliary component
MNVRTLSLAALLPALALAGCVSFGPKPPPELLRLTPAQTAAAGQEMPLTAGQSVTVLIPTAPAEISNTRVPVRSGTSQLAYLKGAQWADVPTRLFRDLLAETIRTRTGRPTLDVRDYHLAPGLRLSGRLQSFGVDSGAMRVDVVYDATLQREGNRIEMRRFEAQAPAGALGEVAVAQALNTAANDVAAQVADWVGK